MSHNHHHHHIDPNAGDARVALAILVNIGLTIAQVIGGLFSGSLALIADALHNFSDAIALIIAFAARRIARRPSDETMTFGYARIEIVAALINYTTLIVLSIYLLYEAAIRFADPQPIDGWLVIIIAIVALAVDLVTALLTFALSKESINIRAAFLHNIADALSSVAVIIGGTFILLYDWRLVDPIVTLIIAIYILWQAGIEIGAVIRILMLGSPPDINGHEVVKDMSAVPMVENVHHVHLWQMDEHNAAVDAHIVIANKAWDKAESVKNDIKAMLREKHDFAHITLELERAADTVCEDNSTYGHQSAKEYH
jgi:cobalt-zinc-cadmium efflux system protein